MKVLIVGGGIGGLCLAQGLRKAEIDVRVFEQQETASESLAGYGIHIDASGRKALHNCLDSSSWDRFHKESTSAGTQLMFRDPQLWLLAGRDDALLSGKPAFDNERRGIGRIELRDILLTGLISSPTLTVVWGKNFTHYEKFNEGRARAHFADGTYEDGDILIGADGSRSKMRELYLPQLKRIDLGILAIAGRYVLDKERMRKLPRFLTDGSLNSIVPKGKGWMFVSAWHCRSSSEGNLEETEATTTLSGCI